MAGVGLRAWTRSSSLGLRRAVPYLAAGMLTSFVSLFLLPLVLTLLVVGWPVLPKVAPALRWWAGIERRRVGRFTGTPGRRVVPGAARVAAGPAEDRGDRPRLPA